MLKVSTFRASLLVSALRFAGLIVVSVILIIVGAIWSDICLYIGLAALATNLIFVFASAIRQHRQINYRDKDNPEFNELMEKLTADPEAFLSEIVGAEENNMLLHGEDLLVLSDDDLFETIYMQNMDIAGEAEDEDKEIEQFTGARRTVYILGLYDAEIQNGGLCQFFVNSSRAVAPYVREALQEVDAKEHLQLFEAFITSNGIDVSNLESFKVFSIRGFKKQTKRYDFDAFDDQYYELPALQDKVVEFIKSHINEF
ncbi:MAG: DUF4375 domain-containing protein [Oscillospiraceae bacterium]|nr:DUF4375 domain-containing protein [Oscillospiraceae bacterium]